jgi:acetyltransferase-like isoleucine patch superfamily enzyme
MFVRVVAAALVAVPGLLSLIDERIYMAFAQVMAAIPGDIGSYLRVAFYTITLERCSRNVSIGWLTYFSRRRARVESGVCIGAACVIGDAVILSGTHIASGVHIVSGLRQHVRAADGALVEGQFERVTIGPHAWLGEGATVGANVGNRATVALGAVVMHQIPDGAMAVGNPARNILQD